MLKLYGHVVRMEDNRWFNRILTPVGRGRRGRPDIKKEKEFKWVMKQRQFNVRRRNSPATMATQPGDLWPTGKLIHT
jgi:hypothetical protein